MMEQYEWDEAKRLQNVVKHGFDFVSLAEFVWDHALVVTDTRQDYGEMRLIAYGPLRGRIVVVVFSLRGEIRRIISLRKANEREIRIYESRINN